MKLGRDLVVYAAITESVKQSQRETAPPGIHFNGSISASRVFEKAGHETTTTVTTIIRIKLL